MKDRVFQSARRVPHRDDTSRGRPAYYSVSRAAGDEGPTVFVPALLESRVLYRATSQVISSLYNVRTLCIAIVTDILDG